MIDKMKEIAAAEKIAVDDDALAAIAYRADGGLRDALTMLEQLAAFSGGEPATTATLDLAFGSTGRQFAQGLVDAAVARNAAGALAIVEDASDAGTDLQVLMRSLITAFRNLLVARIDPALLARDLAADDAERVAQQAQDIPQPTILRALRTFADALGLARAGGNARLELETAMLRFILAGEDPAPESPAVATPAAPKLATPQAAPPKRRSGEVSLQKVRAAWQSIRGKIEGERQSLSAPLSRAAIESVEGNAIVLKLPNKWSAEALRDYTPLIESAIADVLGVPLQLRLRADGNSARAAAAEEESSDALFDYANERIR
jgi:DNA polymerase III gamma/tau subunit